MKTVARCYCAGLPLVPRTPGVAVAAALRERVRARNRFLRSLVAGVSPSEGFSESPCCLVEVTGSSRWSSLRLSTPQQPWHAGRAIATSCQRCRREFADCSPGSRSNVAEGCCGARCVTTTNGRSQRRSSPQQGGNLLRGCTPGQGASRTIRSRECVCFVVRRDAPTATPGVRGTSGSPAQQHRETVFMK